MNDYNRSGNLYSKHYMYKAWLGMRNRCSNKKHPRYKNYGALGITVCAEWDSFGKFLEDMGERPHGMSLDRIDNTAGYSKINCRWATPKEQTRNKSVNVVLSAFGVSMVLADFAKLYGINRKTLSRRLERNWSVVDALTIPINGVHRYAK